MNHEISILGAGGHTRSLINLLEANNFEISGIYDASFDQDRQEVINGYKLLGKPSDITDQVVILSYGNNAKRAQLYIDLSGNVFSGNLIHPLSIIADRCSFGHANQVFAKVCVNANAEIGNNNIINTGAIIEHEVKIGNHNHIAVGAIICGRVELGNLCFIGAGATIIDKIKVVDGVTIGANAVVIKDITEVGTYAGNPARRVK
ncbi:MAG: acetyltransferase [Bacteroidota bacterium]